MNILIATPLFPPDTAPSAVYAKTLSAHLAQKHRVTVLLYGTLPESVPQVRFICIDKRTVLPLRLFQYAVAYWKSLRDADIVYIQNGPSVEFPASLVSFILRKSYIFHYSDIAAHLYAQKKFFRRILEQFTISQAIDVVRDTPPSRPEILPFSPYPKQEMESYARAWDTHITSLETLFKYGNT